MLATAHDSVHHVAVTCELYLYQLLKSMWLHNTPFAMYVVYRCMEMLLLKKCPYLPSQTMMSQSEFMMANRGASSTTASP